MIKRTIQAKIEQWFFKQKVIIIYGARQIGKTTLVKQIAADYGQDFLYMDCDLISNRELLQIQEVQQLKSSIGQYKLLIIDEAQRVQDIGLTLKILHDHFPDLQIIATGSSSFDLSNKISEPLTGRAITFMLYPISVAELNQQYNKLELHARLEIMLRYGLYPEIVDKPESEARELLAMLSGNYLYKDVLEFEQIKKSNLLIKLLQLLALQLGSQVSYHELAVTLGVNQNTIRRYIDLLEKSFIIFRLTSFKRNLRAELGKSFKVYFYDLGIRNSLINNFNHLDLRTDTGGIWENFCIVERLKLNNNKRRFANSYFWRTYDQKELDYIEERDGLLHAFEFKWNPKAKVKKVKQFFEAYPNSAFTVVNRDNFLQELL